MIAGGDFKVLFSTLEQDVLLLGLSESRDEGNTYFSQNLIRK